MINSKNEFESNSLLANIFGWGGTVISTFYYVSPINIFIEMTITKTTTNIPILMIIFNFLNTSCWILYGFSGLNMQYIVCNSIGLGSSLIYFCWFNIFKYKNLSNIIILNIIAIILACGVILSGVYLMKYSGKSDLNPYFGWAGFVTTYLTYAGPGQKLFSVCKTGKYKKIPIFSCFVSVIGSSCWIVFGLTKINAPDYQLLLSSIGIIFPIIQIFIWIYFRIKKQNRDSNITSKKSITHYTNCNEDFSNSENYTVSYTHTDFEKRIIE